MISKLKNQWIELVEEEPKAECGHGLMAGIGIVLFIAFIVAVVVTKP